MILLNILPAPRNRVPAAIVLGLIAILPAYVWHEGTSGFLTDDAVHLLLADFFSPYYERNIYVEHLIAAQARFPPVFPVLIALFGGGSQNMPIAHLVTAGCFVLSALLLFVWARRTLRAQFAALACLVIYILLPESMIYVLELRSEFLYIALVFAAFLLLQNVPETHKRQREVLIAASFIVSLCVLTRTAGIALFGAFLLHLYFQKTSNKPLYIGVFALLPAIWFIIKEVNGYTGNYTEDLVGYLHPEGFINLVTSEMPRNAGLIVDSWRRHLDVDRASAWPYHLTAFILLGLAIVGAVQRATHKSADFFYVLFYVPQLLVWPHTSHIHRLFYPLVPVLLVYAFIGGRLLCAKLSERFARGSHAVIAAALLLFVVPNAVFVAQRLAAPIPDEIPEDYRHTRTWLTDADLDAAYRHAVIRNSVITLLRRTERHLAETSCMYAVHPVSAMLYANRPAIMVPEAATRENLADCDYIFVMNLVGEFKAKYPLGEMNHDMLELLDVEHDNHGRQQAYLFGIKR